MPKFLARLATFAPFISNTLTSHEGQALRRTFGPQAARTLPCRQPEFRKLRSGEEPPGKASLRKKGAQSRVGAPVGIKAGSCKAGNHFSVNANPPNSTAVNTASPSNVFPKNGTAAR